MLVKITSRASLSTGGAGRLYSYGQKVDIDDELAQGWIIAGYAVPLDLGPERPEEPEGDEPDDDEEEPEVPETETPETGEPETPAEQPRKATRRAPRKATTR